VATLRALLELMLSLGQLLWEPSASSRRDENTNREEDHKALCLKLDKKYCQAPENVWAEFEKIVGIVRREMLVVGLNVIL
jgi:hypothetical protein